MLLLKDIAITYHNTVPAVQGVTIEVPTNGVVALLGANGAGKSTILRAIGGLLGFHGGRVTGGAIEFNGQRIDTLTPIQIVRLGITQVLEGRRLFAELTVDENLHAGALATANTAASKGAYDRVMDLFPLLRDRRQSVAGYLSGGEQQMVAIGRGLMANPQLLLLDEPSLGLAPMMIQQISTIIAEISARGIAVLLVEQNAQMALALASFGYVLETGKVRLAMPAKELSHDDAVLKFYLGLQENAQHNSYAALRQQRPARRWDI